MGGQLIVVVLAIAWIAALTPPLLRGWAANRQQPDFNDFYSSLSSLGRQSNSRALADDPRLRRRQQLARRRTAERRRRVFNTLGGTTVFSFVAAVLGSASVLWGLFTLCALLFATYLALLATMARNARPMSAAGRMPYLANPIVPEFVLQRSANS